MSLSAIGLRGIEEVVVGSPRRSARKRPADTQLLSHRQQPRSRKNEGENLDVLQELAEEGQLCLDLETQFEVFKNHYSSFVEKKIVLELFLKQLLGVLKNYSIDIDYEEEQLLNIECDIPDQFKYDSIKSKIDQSSIELSEKLKCLEELIFYLRDLKILIQII